MFCKGKVTRRLSLTLLAVYTSQHEGGQKYFLTWQGKVFDLMFKFQKRVALGGSHRAITVRSVSIDLIQRSNSSLKWNLWMTIHPELGTKSLHFIILPPVACCCRFWRSTLLRLRRISSCWIRACSCTSCSLWRRTSCSALLCSRHLASSWLWTPIIPLPHCRTLPPVDTSSKRRIHLNSFPAKKSQKAPKTMSLFQG